MIEITAIKRGTSASSDANTNASTASAPRPPRSPSASKPTPSFWPLEELSAPRPVRCAGLPATVTRRKAALAALTACGFWPKLPGFGGGYASTNVVRSSCERNASATLNALGYALGPPFGPTIALFYVAADERTRGRLRETAVVLLGLSAVHVGVTAIFRGSTAVPILSGIVLWGGAWIVGDQLRQRRQRRADLEERTRRAERELERERRLAAAVERTRIARDLHDSAAHAINVILVQGGAPRLLQQRNRGAAQEALSTIEDVARETIGEIDQLIRGLRENSASSPADAAIEPPTGL